MFTIRPDSERGESMSISDQIRVLCARLHISMAELARRMGMSPQSLNAKIRRESFSVSDLDQIAYATGTSFSRKFILASGEEV